MKLENDLIFADCFHIDIVQNKFISSLEISKKKWVISSESK